MRRKPVVSLEAVTELLATLVSDAPVGLARLEEGLESQTFAFGAGEDAFVLRISAPRRGLEEGQVGSGRGRPVRARSRGRGRRRPRQRARVLRMDVQAAHFDHALAGLPGYED